MMMLKLTIVVFTVLLACVARADYRVDDLQKLFTDKQQRERIDAIRSGRFNSGENRKSEKVHVSGYVTRSDGKNIVWLNNKNTINNSRVDDVKVYRSMVGKNKKITISVDGKSVRLKPGETWYKNSGKIVDNH